MIPLQLRAFPVAPSLAGTLDERIARELFCHQWLESPFLCNACLLHFREDCCIAIFQLSSTDEKPFQNSEELTCLRLLCHARLECAEGSPLDVSACRDVLESRALRDESSLLLTAVQMTAVQVAAGQVTAVTTWHSCPLGLSLVPRLRPSLIVLSTNAKLQWNTCAVLLARSWLDTVGLASWRRPNEGEARDYKRRSSLTELRRTIDLTKSEPQ